MNFFVGNAPIRRLGESHSTIPRKAENSDWRRCGRCASLGRLLPGSRPSGGRLESTKGMGVLSGASVVLALPQSFCTAVLTINSVRLGIGLTALFAGGIAAPLISFHHSAIRIPMLVVAVVGAVVDLAVLGWIRHLRARPESQWRRREITKTAPFRAAPIRDGDSHARPRRRGDLGSPHRPSQPLRARRAAFDAEITAQQQTLLRSRCAGIFPAPAAATGENPDWPPVLFPASKAFK